MALVFPLPVAEFAGLFKVSDRRFDLSESRELNETLGGDLVTADQGPRLWHGSYTLSKLVHRDYQAIKGLIEALQVGDRAFYAFDHLLPGLSSDPAGVGVSSLSPVVHELNDNNRELRLSGLAPGLKLNRGDRFSFVCTSGAIAMHRVLTETVVAGADGATPLFEVGPHILPGAGVGNPVTLFKPYIKARIVPNSFKPGRAEKLYVEGAKFDFVQQVKP
jgi:hypothetical protein